MTSFSHRNQRLKWKSGSLFFTFHKYIFLDRGSLKEKYSNLKYFKCKDKKTSHENVMNSMSNPTTCNRLKPYIIYWKVGYTWASASCMVGRVVGFLGRKNRRPWTETSFKVLTSEFIEVWISSQSRS